MKLEALENRQLLVGIIDDGVETESNFLHEPSGNTLDLVRLTGQIVTVTADEHQITRVSYIDLDGDLVNVDFAGAGEMSISLADEGFIASADFYESSPYSGLNDEFGFVTGKASFFIVGSDATTYFSVFTVGPANDFPDASVTGVGGDGVADITRVIITADPSNPFDSNFNSLFLANTRFTGSTGIVGISTVNVNVKGAVQIGDLNASDSGVPTLLFGAASQFGTV